MCVCGGRGGVWPPSSSDLNLGEKEKKRREARRATVRPISGGCSDTAEIGLVCHAWYLHTHTHTHTHTSNFSQYSIALNKNESSEIINSNANFPLLIKVLCPVPGGSCGSSVVRLASLCCVQVNASAPTVISPVLA